MYWRAGTALLDSPRMAEEHRNRRLDPRVASGIIQVEYVVPPGPQVRDLSTTGLYLKDPRPLQRGQPVELWLRLEQAEPIVIQGMVRRVDPGEGMGIEFIQMDAAGRRRIKEFISRVSPDKISPAGEDIF